MTLIRGSRFGRFLCFAVVLAMISGLVPAGISRVEAKQKVQTVLLFEVSDESASGLPELTRMATDALQMHIDQTKGLECTEFSETSPLVRRALAEGRIVATQVSTGPTDPADAIEIGHGLKVDVVVMASIELYRSTSQPRMVETILSGQAYDVKANFDADRGRAVSNPQVTQALGITGTSSKMPGYKGTDKPLASEAINQAAYRVAQILAGKKMSEVANSKPRKKDDDNDTEKILAYLAGLLLLGLLVSESGGDDAAGPSPQAVPPEPQALELIGGEPVNGIRITWRQPTGTSWQLLRYELQRSVNGGTFSYFASGNASRDIDPGDLTFTDFDVQDGNTYLYRMRAVYQNSAFSRWVRFDTIRP